MHSPVMIDPDALERWREAAQAGARFLAAKQDANGAFAEAPSLLVCHYKSPSAFFRTGYAGHAARNTVYIRQAFLGIDGTLQLGSGPDNYLLDFEPYPYGWLASSSLLLGLVADGRAFYKRMFDYRRDEGGVCADDSATPRVCLGMSAWLGLAAQLFGDAATANGQASFLVGQVSRQGAIERRFLTALDASGEFMTEPPHGKTWHEVPVDAEPGGYQWYWLPALVAVFLAKEHELTGSTASLEAARKCFDFLERCGDAAFESSAYGKPGWAAAVLWRVTGDRGYLQRAIQVLDRIADVQADNGSWVFNPGADPPEVTLDVTAEWVHWLRVIAGEMLAAPYH